MPSWVKVSSSPKYSTMIKVISILVCFCSLSGYAQVPYPAAPALPGAITVIEYFIDSNPGFGSGTALTGFTSSVNIDNFNGSVNLSGLPAGLHRIYFRCKDANGKWSLTNSAFFDNFNVPVYNTAPPATGAISNIEYFFDTDPAFGSGIALTGFSSSPDINNFNGSINLFGLPSGMHRIFFRCKEAGGKWSLTNDAFFDNYNVPVYNSSPPVSGAITGIEYFFDNNPEFGSGIALTGFSSSPAISNLNGSVNLSGLPTGMHRIYFRSKDANGIWSLTNDAFFDNFNVPVYSTAPSVPANIVQLEYFIDNNDAGFGNCTQIPLSANTNVANLKANINISGLVKGVHRLFIRSKDANGKWSITNLSVFSNASVMPYPVVAGAAPPISNMEYFIDNDPGFGNATPITVPGNSNDLGNFNININLSGSLSIGTHYLYIRSKQNPWSITNVVPFSAAGVLPVTLMFVKAQVSDRRTLLSWATAQESNTHKFEIEHSTDGKVFSKIGALPAAGYSTDISNYNFTHDVAVTGFNYYRIKQMDLDGKFTYSVIVSVLLNEGLKQTILAPNPVNDILNVVEPKQIFTRSAEIFNASGSLLICKTVNADVQIYSIPVSKLVKGLYILRINYNKESKSIRFIKE